MSPHKTNKNMETSFKQTTSNKVERYRLFLPQFELLISDEKEEISVLANTAAALREAFGFFWVGFYLVKDDQLILGPFQGSPPVIASIKEREYVEPHGQKLEP